MRKIIHMFIAAVLLVSTTGMTINLHYCHEQLYDVGLNTPAESCCENGFYDHHCYTGISSELPDHCQDESIAIRITDDFLTVANPTITPTGQNEDSFFQVHLTSNLDVLFGKYNIVSKLENHNLPPTQKTYLSQIQSYRL